jgi:hypothetical protein
VEGVEPVQGGVLTVALSGSPLATFLQEEPFYTGYHIAVLKPRSTMSREVMLYYAACLQANRYRFSYGRQANRTLGSLMVPCDSRIPGWATAAVETEAGRLSHQVTSFSSLDSKGSLPKKGALKWSLSLTSSTANGVRI